MPTREWFSRFPKLTSRLIVVVALNFASGLLMIWQAALLAGIVDDVFLRHHTLTSSLHSLEMLIIAIGLRALFFGLGDKAGASLSVRVREDLRLRLIRHFIDLGPVYFRTEKSGELLNTAMTGVEQVDVYVAKYLPQAVHAFLLPVAVWCVVVGTDFWAALILAVTAPLIPLFMILIGKGAETVTKRQWRAMSLLGGHFLDVIRGLTTLKLFHRSRAQIQIISHMTHEYREATMRSLRIAFLSALVLELLTTLSTAVVAVMLGLRLLNGGIDFHRAFLILLLAPEFYQPIRMIGTQFHASLNGVESAKRIFSILDLPADAAELKSSSKCHPDGQKVRINADAAATSDPMSFQSMVFQNVTFTYPASEQPALRNVTFQVSHGQMVALVGSSGAGKSSVFDLLLGFARPQEGQILINGLPLEQWRSSDWRRQVAYVPQKPHLFAKTIADNIRFVRPDAGQEEVEEAAQAALAHEFIVKLPQGYETHVTEDLELSGGQVQRLAIARAMMKKASVVCLDEPTSQLDVASEHALQSAIQSLRREATVIVAAHRLPTIMAADVIVVMNEGGIVESGSHAELLAANGRYADLWHSAMDALQDLNYVGSRT